MHAEWYDRVRSPMPNTEPAYKVGQWDVGYVFYGYTTEYSRSGCPHEAVVTLPGFKTQFQGHYATEEEAKERVEEVVAWWIEALLADAPEPTAVRRIYRAKPQAKAPAIHVRRSPRAGVIVTHRRRRT